MAWEAIFQPIKIGAVEIKNRIGMAPMAIHDYTVTGGAPTNQAICYFNARAKGGVGLIDCGAILATRPGEAELSGNISALYDGRHSYAWCRLVRSVHEFGSKIFAQMSPGFGRKAMVEHPSGASPIPIDKTIIEEGMPEKAMAYKPWWPTGTTFFYRIHEAIPREMTIDEIRDYQRQYVQSCMLAIQVGFDGIELHACHGYLLDQFLSPVANHRTDIYGGDLKARARFLLELLTKTKNVFKDRVPVTVRISGSSRIEEYGGNGPEEMRQVAKWCEDLGADAIHLSDGLTTERYKYMWADRENTEPGRLIDIQGKKLKQVIKIPVITPSIHVPENIERVIEEGETDMVSLGRQLVTDPDFVNKLKEGKRDKIKMCTRCFWCLGMGVMGGQGILNCLENPQAGDEQFMPEYWPKSKRPKIPESLKRWQPSGRLVNLAGEE